MNGRKSKKLRRIAKELGVYDKQVKKVAQRVKDKKLIKMLDI